MSVDNGNVIDMKIAPIRSSEIVAENEILSVLLYKLPTETSISRKFCEQSISDKHSEDNITEFSISSSRKRDNLRRYRSIHKGEEKPVPVPIYSVDWRAWQNQYLVASRVPYTI